MEKVPKLFRLGTWWLMHHYLTILSSDVHHLMHLRKCYKDSLKAKKKSGPSEASPKHEVSMVDIDPREGSGEDGLTPQEEIKDVQIGPLPSQVTHLGTQLTKEEETE